MPVAIPWSPMAISLLRKMRFRYSARLLAISRTTVRTKPLLTHELWWIETGFNRRFNETVLITKHQSTRIEKAPIEKGSPRLELHVADQPENEDDQSSFPLGIMAASLNRCNTDLKPKNTRWQQLANRTIVAI